MRRPLNREADEINDFYSGLLSSSDTSASPLSYIKRTKLARHLRARKRAQASAEQRQQASRTAYRQFVESAKKPDPPYAFGAPLQTLGRKTTAPRKRFKLLFFVVGILCVAIIAAGGYIYWRSQKQITPTTKNDISPDTVIVPMKLPEGYTVGSSLQSLENGAKLYTVYTDKGQQITVNQQAKHPDFTQPAIKGATYFKTKAGDAFILAEDERLTGYLFSEKVWVLFNSKGLIEPADMRQLIEVFEP